MNFQILGFIVFLGGAIGGWWFNAEMAESMAHQMALGHSAYIAETRRGAVAGASDRARAKALETGVADAKLMRNISLGLGILGLAVLLSAKPDDEPTQPEHLDGD